MTVETAPPPDTVAIAELGLVLFEAMAANPTRKDPAARAAAGRVVTMAHDFQINPVAAAARAAAGRVVTMAHDFQINPVAAAALAFVRGLPDPRDGELASLRAELAAMTLRATHLAELLRRYRTQTPIGHQPHMIAHEVDKLLQETP